jgi:hypothetical protein
LTSSCPGFSCKLFTIYRPLQGPPAPTSQIPICVTPLLLLELLLTADKEPEEYACAFWVAIVDTKIESRLIAIIGNRNINLLFFIILIYYIWQVKNKL